MTKQKKLSTDRNFLLPVIVAALLVIGLLGTGAPNDARPAKSKSIPRNAAEVQVKKAEDGSLKIAQIAEFCIRPDSFAPTTFYISSWVNTASYKTYALANSRNPRAPPVQFLI